MVNFKIEPHVGIGCIKLGAKRDDVRACLAANGFPHEMYRDSCDYFCSSAIQVGYDDGDCVQIIGISCEKSISVTYENINVFDVPAEEIFSIMATNDNSGNHDFDECEFIFPNQILTLWDADTQYDTLGGWKRVVWGQVGLGSKAYWDAYNEVRGN
jgi:hypothetical protein